MKDYQKQKLYNWEDENLPLPTQFLSNKKLAKLISRILINSKTKKIPQLILPNDIHYKYAWANNETVLLPKWARNKFIICHELAHFIDANLNNGKTNHGPKFVGIYIYLLNRFCRISKKYLINSLNKSNIKYESFDCL